MYLWRTLAAVSWWSRNEPEIRAEGANDLAIIERPGRKRLILEISCRTWARARELERRFGGRITKLPCDWLARFSRTQEIKPLIIGRRLVVANVGGSPASRRAKRQFKRSRHSGPSHIVIPAGTAFGTGQHPTTAMSLRMLEQLTRRWKRGWSMVDLGTGSGIFALAAKCFGARTVIAIDIDPVAISTAKANAATNRISGVRFKVADVLRQPLPKRIDVVTANLFSELLIRIAPKLKRVSWLILSGILREQQPGVRRALKQNGFVLETVRRRGKWIAAIARRGARGSPSHP
jgi:ribosomal protein L11 methyltransferase